MRFTQRIAAATVAGCAALAALWSASGDGRTVLDGWLFDTALAVKAHLAPDTRPAAEIPVAVVAIDERSLASEPLSIYPLGLFAPVWAETIQALTDAGAQAVAFDLIMKYSAGRLTRELNLKGFRRFETDLRRTLNRNREKIVLGRSEATLPPRSITAPLRAYGDRLGLLDLEADRDGVYRRVRTAFATADGGRANTLVGELLTRLPDAPAAPPEEILVAPGRHPESLPAYAVIDVLRCARTKPEALKQAFAGKAVFLGITRPDQDRKRSPGRFMPAAPAAAVPEAPCALHRLGASDPAARTVAGVFLHAAATDALLTGRVTRPLPAPARILIAAAAGAAGALLAVALGPALAIAGALALSLFLWGGEILLLGGQLWFAAGLPILALIGAMITAYIVRYLLEERQRRHIQAAFGRYLAPQVVDQLLDSADGPQLGGAVRPVTVMFADLSGFTAMSTRMPADELMHLVNGYLAKIADEVVATGGYVDKFIGDAVMAIWGAPGDDPDHALHAVQAALKMAEVIKQDREAAEARGEPGFGIKIGIHTGDAVVGNVGSRDRVNYTAVGETVNIAARLEGLPGLYGCPVIIGDTTALAVEGKVALREIDWVAVKGRSEPLAIFEARPAEYPSPSAFSDALEAYRVQAFTKARTIWTDLANAGDEVSEIMRDRAADYESNPPGANWDGVWVMTTK